MSAQPNTKKKRKNKEHSIEAGISNSEEFETKRLFLKAVLAEYDRLNDEIMNHQRNTAFLLSILVGGSATILGVSGIIGMLSLLVIPIFVSIIALLVLAENYTCAFIGKYIKEEIEDKKLGKLFPEGSPIQWESQFQASHAQYNTLFFIGLFVLSFLLCVGCLVLVTLNFWDDIYSNVVNQLLFFFSWIIVISYSALALGILRRLVSFVKSH